jgi:hypothetical protein
MNDKANPHHLVMGELTDFLTGEKLPDTHDERYRQKISRWLVDNSGFSKQDISSNIKLAITADEHKGFLKIDFLVSLDNKHIIMIKYAPGSLVTRRLSTLALSRVISPYQIPYAVITNGQDAEIIDGNTGKVIGNGLEGLINKTDAKKRMAQFSFNPVGKKLFDQASRIAYACEIDGACPCDTDVCLID